MRTSLVTRTSAGALTAAMAVVPAVCQAQSFQATPSVAFGTVTIDQTVANTTTVTVDSNRAIVDWTRSDLPGTTQFTFQPAGTTANFVKGSGAGAAPYAILNRIASTEASASALFDGTVNDVSGGNSIFFYNSGGFVLGANSRFNVGNLVLSAGAFALDGASDFFPGSNQFSVATAAGSAAHIDIQTGAQINSSVTGSQSFVVAVAPKISQAGAITTAGSSALVAAEAAAFQFTSGLFDITVSSGTDVGGNALTHSGSTGGSASTGAGDFRRAYLVAVPKNTALTMAIGAGSNLGFAIAGAADVVGNTIVLSAGHNVVATGAGDPFVDSPVNGTAASIQVVEGSYTSNFNARAATNANFVNAAGSATLFASDVSMRAGSLATISNAPNATLEIRGSAVLDASARSALVAGASRTGGTARFETFESSTTSVTGNLTISADGAGDPLLTGLGNGGTGTGGFANLGNNAGTMTIGGNLLVTADGFAGGNLVGSGANGNAAGGNATVFSHDFNGTNGLLTVNGNVDVSASAFAAALTSAGVTSGDATAGQAVLVANLGGAMNILGNARALGQAFGGHNLGGGTGIGGNATGGSTVLIGTVDPTATMSITGTALSDSSATGGDSNSATGRGGNAVGGQSQIRVAGASTLITGLASMVSNGTGGSGTGGAGGGNGTGGIVFQDAGTGLMSLANGNLQSAVGKGGSASGTAAGGTGTGGSLRLFAASAGSLINLTGNQLLDARGFGGGATAAGIGGNGIGGSASIDGNGTTTVSGSTDMLASGFGGTGGTGGNAQGGTANLTSSGTGVFSGQFLSLDASAYAANSTGSGNGGNAVSGNANIATSAAGAPGGQINLGNSVFINTLAIGGIGGGTTGNGGNATAGGSAINANLGIIRLTGAGATYSLNSSATGGSGAIGGNATGARSSLFGDGTTGQLLQTGAGANFEINADALGGGGSNGAGGNAIAGFAEINPRNGGLIRANAGTIDLHANSHGGNATGGDGGSAGSSVNNLAFDTVKIQSSNGATADLTGTLLFSARATGGNSTTGKGGRAFGNGRAFIFADRGTGTIADGATATITGNVTLNTNANGGATTGTGSGGAATGGSAFIRTVNTASLISITGNVVATSNGLGGASGAAGVAGGAGTGGSNPINAVFGTLTISGSLNSQMIGTGGQGNTGGLGQGGFSVIGAGHGPGVAPGNPGTATQSITGATISDTSGIGGNALSGRGGDGRGGQQVFGSTILEAATSSFGAVTLTNAGTGGAGGAGAIGQAGGAGGDGFGGTTDIASISNQTMGAVSSSTSGIGGNGGAGGVSGATGGAGGAGGNATGGNNKFFAFRPANSTLATTLTTSGPVSLNGNATGGNGGAGGLGTLGTGNGGAGGSATSQIVQVFGAARSVTIGGAVSAAASAFGGNGGTGAATGAGGAATGGQVSYFASQDAAGVAGSLTAASANLNASANGGNGGPGSTGGAATGGLAASFAGGSTLTTNGALDAFAFANGGNGQTGGAATGGTARQITSAGGTQSVTGTALLNANATGGTGTADGGAATGGTAQVLVDVVGSVSTVTGGLSVAATGNGGAGTSGTGGLGTGGTASIDVTGGSFTANNTALVAGAGFGGTGRTGGNAQGGIANMTVNGGSLRVAGTSTVAARALGGAASAGLAGTGGNAIGGTSEVAVVGTATASALTLADVGQIVTGSGGNGGSVGAVGLPPAFPGGRGGDGTGGTAKIGSSSSAGTVVMGAVTTLANAFGGAGGAAGTGGTGGAGGNATAGTTNLGFGPNASALTGTFNLASASVQAGAVGGVGGSGGLGGAGGSGFGGTAFAGTMAGGVLNITGLLALTTSATGSVGGLGSTNGATGLGSGGNTYVGTGINPNVGSLSTLSAGNTQMFADGLQEVRNATGTVLQPIDNYGRTNVVAQGGLINLTSLSMFARGVAPSSVAPYLGLTTSGVSASGANINMPGAFNAEFSGDSVLVASGGNIFTGFFNYTTASNVLIGPGNVPPTGTGQVRAVGPLNLSATGAIATTANLVSIAGPTGPALLNVTAGTDLATGAVVSQGFASLLAGGLIASGGVQVTNGDFDATAGTTIALGNVRADGDIDMTAGGNVTTGALSAGDTVDIQTLGGSITTGNIDAGIVTPSTLPGAEYTVGMLANGNVSTGTVDAAGPIGIGSLTGSVSAGNITTGDLFLTLASTGVSLGGITTPTVVSGNTGQIYIADSSMIALITPGVFDPTPVLNAVPVPLAGPVSISGPVSTGIFTSASTGSFTALSSITASQRIYIRSGDLSLGTGGSLGDANTPTLELVIDESAAAIALGGAQAASGYSLTQAEAARLRAQSIIFTVASSEPPEVNLGTMSLRGSNAGALANLNGTGGSLAINTLGNIRVTGGVDFGDMAPGNSVLLTAGGQILLDTSSGGAVRLAGASPSDPGGTLRLAATDIWAANSSVLSQLLVNPNFAGRDALLNQAPAVPLAQPVLQANTIFADVGSSLLIANTGTFATFAGFAAGSGGFEVTAVGGSQLDPVDVVINGSALSATGVLLRNGSTRDSFLFNGGSLERALTTTSSINGCLFSAEICSAVIAPEVMQVVVQTQTVPQTLEAKTEEEREKMAEAVEQSDTEPDVAMSRLVDNSQVADEGVIDEPVSGSGNPSLWPTGPDLAIPLGEAK